MVSCSHLLYKTGIASVFFIQFPQFLFPINIRLIKSIHRPAAQIITPISKITRTSALIQPLLDDADSLFFCCVFDQYT